MYGLRIIDGVLILLTYLSSLLRTGQKDALVEEPSVLSFHGEGPITHLMPRCTSFTCCCMMLSCLNARPHTYADRTEGCSGGETFCAQLPWGGAYYLPEAQMYVLHMSLHGALMLEGSPALMWTGQENVLVEGPSVLSCYV